MWVTGVQTCALPILAEKITSNKLTSSKKMSSKHIDMGSSFEDLVATSPTVKTDLESDERIKLQNILNFQLS